MGNGTEGYYLSDEDIYLAQLQMEQEERNVSEPKQKGIYPTGVWLVVKRELLDDDISFVTKEIAKEMGLYNEVHEQ